MTRFRQINRVVEAIDKDLSFLFREKGDRGKVIGILNDLIISESRKITSVMTGLRRIVEEEQMERLRRELTDSSPTGPDPK